MKNKELYSIDKLSDISCKKALSEVIEFEELSFRFQIKKYKEFISKETIDICVNSRYHIRSLYRRHCLIKELKKSERKTYSFAESNLCQFDVEGNYWTFYKYPYWERGLTECGAPLEMLSKSEK